MLRVAEQAFRSDTGRQRTANEDAHYASAPTFAVADGMGGAQAGEVASRIAADAFEAAERGDRGPEAHLRSIAEAANAQIHDLAAEDSTRSGMGTTLTAAMVEGDEVSLAHVGDSRAYALRDRELRLLTSDHSLVEELRRQGRLTDEQAHEHPQRSIITRALGPESDVEVDTLTVSARPGDVFLLCSDGLTTMLSDERIAEVLLSAPNLDAAVRQLVREANEAGGRDNITVVAFRLEDAEAERVDEQATLVGPSAAEAGLTPEALRPERARRPAPARRSRVGTALKVGAGVLLAGLVVGGAIYGARQVYFLGADEGGRLALYRGLPYDLPLGVELYSELYSVPVQVASLPDDRRPTATDHELRSRSDAISLLDDLQASAEEASRAGGAGTRDPGQAAGRKADDARDGSGDRTRDRKPSGGGQNASGNE